MIQGIQDQCCIFLLFLLTQTSSDLKTVKTSSFKPRLGLKLIVSVGSDHFQEQTLRVPASSEKSDNLTTDAFILTVKPPAEPAARRALNGVKEVCPDSAACFQRLSVFPLGLEFQVAARLRPWRPGYQMPPSSQL